jgi:hypothetical protein
MSKTRKQRQYSKEYLENAGQLKRLLDCNHRNNVGLWKKYDPVRLSKKSMTKILQEKLAFYGNDDGNVNYMFTNPYLAAQVQHDLVDFDCDVMKRLESPEYKELNFGDVQNMPLIMFFNLDPNDKLWYKRATERQAQKAAEEERRRAENTFTHKIKKWYSNVF